MEQQINLSVTFQGDTQTFLVSDSSNTTWADVEAMVKVSFELSSIQIKYLDEDHDEVSVNSAEEYEEALKIAVKQGNQLQMNVYELSSPSGTPSQQVPEKSEKTLIPTDGKKPLSYYSMLARSFAQGKGKGNGSERENERKQAEHCPSEVAPEWFTSYLEKFREQVVHETVEMLEQKLSEKLFLSNQFPSSLSSSTHHVPLGSSVQGNPFDWLLSCSNCQAAIVGIRYQCSLCPSYSICELCEAGLYAHDPNHVLLKLRRPVLCISETYNLGQFSPRLAALEQVRLQKQMDKRFLKAEKRRLRAEKKQRKAEVRELKNQLKLHRKIHLWNSVHALENTGLTTNRSENQSSTLLPLQGCPVIVPTLSAAFVDENLPDGTCLQPRTTFIKHWHMKNTGNMEWTSDTKLKFMWGNLTLLSSEKKDVTVPSLLPGQVGVVSVEFIAPSVEGTYTSHWRLSHRGEQFGPRIWCSIVVDPTCSNGVCPESSKLIPDIYQKSRSHCNKEEKCSEFKTEPLQVADSVVQGSLGSRGAPTKLKSILSATEFYIPSVDLLTAQDLLSFELLDINIVQELEQVPHNTPVDMTPYMSPQPHGSPLPEKVTMDHMQEENKESICKPQRDAQVGKGKVENAINQEEGEEDMSGTQFVCETVIRSLTLDAAPDHQPPQKMRYLQSSQRATLQDGIHQNLSNKDPVRIKHDAVSISQEESSNQDLEESREPGFEKLLVPESEELTLDEKEVEDDSKDEVCSQASSTSSEDYIIILPECFDTSRPLGESMYSSALSQPSLEKTAEGQASSGEGKYPPSHSIGDILTIPQTLDEVPLTPQIVEPHLAVEPQVTRSVTPSQNSGNAETNFPSGEYEALVPNQIRGELQRADISVLPYARNINCTSPACPEFSRQTHNNSLAGGLVKGALSVAASAYKALFSGLPSIEPALPVAPEDHMDSFLAKLSEMGFSDRQLNLRLLRRHNCDLPQVVTELLHLSQSDWYENQY